MTEVPKIVHQRLRAIRPQPSAALQVHPEADVLNAFMEQALPAGERDILLHHLILCADCREVVALALPVSVQDARPVEAAAPIEKKHIGSRTGSPWFAWPGLRWAALAAGIAVAVLVVRPVMERGTRQNLDTSSANRSSSSVARPAVTPQLSSELRAEPPTNARNEAPVSKSTVSKPDLKPKMSFNKPGIAQPAAPSPQAGSVALVAGTLNDLTKDSAARKKETAVPATADSVALDARAGAQIQTSDSSLKTSVNSEDSSTKNTLARADAPAIVKAKPPVEQKTLVEPQKMMAANAATGSVQARDELSAKRVAAAPAARTPQTTTWTITDGALQRSRDGGQSWQIVVRADHALLCYAPRNQEVWAGGQAGTLYHSSDGGLTWMPVAVTYKGEALHSDIVAIDVSAPIDVIVSTNTHETWSSADGGKNWEKK